MKVALRVDVDFSFGLTKGVPWLLELFNEYGVKATFFTVMGPDTVSAHGKRVKSKGYLKRLLAMNPVKMLYKFGPLFMLRGKILPIRYVGKGHPDIIKKIISSGHELGLHGWNHVYWADRWEDITAEEIASEIGKADAVNINIFGKSNPLWGSPNWRVMSGLYKYLDRQNIKYSSNCRGCTPFYPQYGNEVFNVMELPISMPATHELVQAGVSKSDVPAMMKDSLTDEYNMMVIHGYYEGLLERAMFEKTLRALLEVGVEFTTCESLYSSIDISSIGYDTLETIKVPGGFGDVSAQTTFLQKNYFDKVLEYCR